MGPLRLGDFVGVVRGELIGPATDIEIEHPATHSSRIHSGAAFFALPGSRADGHDFVGSAARNGAAAAVVKAGRLNEEIRAAGIPIVAVDDPLRALQRLAAWWRRSLDTRFVAVVGSIGKTVTKDCLVHLLSARRPVYGTPGSYNSQLGVPLAILGCPRTAETAVIEVAVSDPGEMGRLAAVVQPDDVVLTNVGTRWRYRFADRRAQMRELLQIAADRPLVLGEADAELRAAAEEIASAVQVVGASPGLPAFTRRRRDRDADIAVTFPDGQTASLVVRTPSVEILDDVELAVSAAWRLGLDAAAIGEALADYTPTSTRMEIWPSPSGVTLVRDAATPDPMAVGAAVRAAKRLERHGGRTVVVLGPPAGTWGAQAAADLAHALVSERADEVLAVVAGADDRLVRVTDQLEGRLPVRLFAEMDELRRHLVDGLGPGDVCLVQSPPGRGIGDLSSSIAEAMAPTRLYLDLAALEENVTTFRRLVGPKVRILAMVKALAYGTDPVAMAQALAHGDDAVALTLDLQESGVDCLGVSNADEGVALRRAGVTVPILVMLGTEAELDKMVRYSLTPLLYSETMVAAVTTLAKDGVQAGRVAVHLDVDTGMHNSGLFWSDVAVECLEELARLDHVEVEGLMTHLASADIPEQDDLTREQLRRFEHVVEAAHALGLHPLLHAAATAGTIRFPAARYDMVRVGLGLFGLHPSPATAQAQELAPVISVVSRILQIIEAPAGDGVGYGATHTVGVGGERLAVVPAGYADGVPRAFSNAGYVLVAGVRCPIVGHVRMDEMTIDVSGCPDAAIGSDVLIYGRLGDAEVPWADVARSIGTIPYELMARVGPRVQRVLTRH